MNHRIKNLFCYFRLVFHYTRSVEFKGLTEIPEIREINCTILCNAKEFFAPGCDFPIKKICETFTSVSNDLIRTNGLEILVCALRLSGI